MSLPPENCKWISCITTSVYITIIIYRPIIHFVHEVIGFTLCLKTELDTCMIHEIMKTFVSYNFAIVCDVHVHILFAILLVVFF